MSGNSENSKLDIIRVSPDEASARLTFTDIVAYARRPALFEDAPDLPDRVRGALGRKLEGLAIKATDPLLAEEAAGAWRTFFGAAGRDFGARPYVVRVDANAREIKIVLRLFGAAAKFARVSEVALAVALEQGIAIKHHGYHRVRFSIDRLEKVSATGTSRRAAPASAVIILRTPLALRVGSAIKSSLVSLPSNVAHRALRLAPWLGYKVTFDSLRLSHASAALEWEESCLTQDFWEHHSSSTNARNARVPLAGLTGKVHVRGDLGPVWPFLRLGADIHAGSETAMGLGRYETIALP